MPFCTDQSAMQWVQIDGVMSFTYKTKDGQALTAPVKWPDTSHILIPTTVENGVRKFDGYCPEPSVADAARKQP